MSGLLKDFLRTFKGLPKDFQMTSKGLPKNSKGLPKDFQRNSEGLWTLWSTKFTSLLVAAPRSSRLISFLPCFHSPPNRMQIFSLKQNIKVNQYTELLIQRYRLYWELISRLFYCIFPQQNIQHRGNFIWKVFSFSPHIRCTSEASKGNCGSEPAEVQQ